MSNDGDQRRDNGSTFDHEKLDAYQRAIEFLDLVDLILEATPKGLASDMLPQQGRRPVRDRHASILRQRASSQASASIRAASASETETPAVPSEGRP